MYVYISLFCYKHPLKSKRATLTCVEIFVRKIIQSQHTIDAMHVRISLPAIARQ